MCSYREHVSQTGFMSNIVNPSKPALKLLVLLKEISDLRTSLSPISAICLPPTSADLVLEAFHITESCCDIAAWCQMVREYTAQPEYSVPAFKNLGRVQNRRAVAPYVIRKMC